MAAHRCSNAAAAVASIAELRPALVVTAQVLPDISGFGLAAALKTCDAYSDTFVVVMSTSPDERRVERFCDPDLILPKTQATLQAGLEDFLDLVNLSGSKRPVEPVGLRGEVLLADDDQVSQRLAASFLRRAGVDVTAVDDGREAVRRVSRGDYRLLVLDIEMPRFDGWEAIRRIRQHGVNTPAIAVTGHRETALLARCHAAGFNSVIVKPVDRATLLSRCARYL